MKQQLIVNAFTIMRWPCGRAVTRSSLELKVSRFKSRVVEIEHSVATATTLLLKELRCPGAMTGDEPRKFVTRFGVIQRV